MTEREQPYGNFREWLLDQAGRPDSVGDLARELADDADFIDVLRQENEESDRSDNLDALRVAGREWDVVRQRRHSLEELQRLERFLYYLLERVHSETDCGRDGKKHWDECTAIVFAFGWKSWEEWQTIGMALTS